VMRSFQGDGWVPGAWHELPGNHAEQQEQVEQHPNLTGRRSPSGLLCCRGHTFAQSIAGGLAPGKQSPASAGQLTEREREQEGHGRRLFLPGRLLADGRQRHTSAAILSTGPHANAHARIVRWFWLKGKAPRERRAEGGCALAGFRAFMGRWVGGTAVRIRGGQRARAGRLGLIATRVTNMKIIDVPQSGHLGTFISFKNRFGQFRRRYVVPKDPRTSAQLSVRSRFGRISARWRVLTDAQRAAWTAFSTEVASRGRLGKSGPLTGCQLFVKINTNLAFVGMEPVTDPPDYPRFGANPVGSLTITNVRGAIALKLSVPSAPAQHTLVWGTVPGSAGASFPGRFTFLGLLPAPVAGVSNITELYVAKYGVPPVTKRVFIHTRQQVNGWQDAPKQTTAVVPPA
jgi:hypothetical protein